MMQFDPRRTVLATVFAGLMLASGCSLLGGGHDSPAPAPPMIGAAVEGGVKKPSRPKIRFASEVSNVRDKHAKAKKRREALERSQSAVASTSPGVAGPPPPWMMYPHTTPPAMMGPPPQWPLVSQRLPTTELR